MKELVAAPLKEAAGGNDLPVCWSGEGAIRSFSQVVNFFKPLTISFGKEVAFEIRPSGYLILTVSSMECLMI